MVSTLYVLAPVEVGWTLTKCSLEAFVLKVVSQKVLKINQILHSVQALNWDKPLPGHYHISICITVLSLMRIPTRCLHLEIQRILFYQKRAKAAHPIAAGQNKHKPKLLIKPAQLVMTWTFCVSRGSYSAPYGTQNDRGTKKRNLQRVAIIKARSRSLGFEYARRSSSAESVYRQPSLIRQSSPVLLLLQFTALRQLHSPAPFFFFFFYATLHYQIHKLV